MKCCKAAHVILDFGVNGLATYTTRAVLGRIFPVFYGRVGKMGGLRISSNGIRMPGTRPNQPIGVPARLPMHASLSACGQVPSRLMVLLQSSHRLVSLTLQDLFEEC